MRHYHVYILSNASRTLYVGITNELERRLEQHRAGEGGDFTRRYHCHKLVWHQAFAEVNFAIATEKRIKGWSRAKKIALIDEKNPARADLAPAEKTGPLPPRGPSVA